MYTNEFGQTVKADLAIVFTTAEELASLSAVILNRMTQSSTPYIDFNVMEGHRYTLEAEIHDLDGEALERFNEIIPSSEGIIHEPSFLAMRFIRFIFDDEAQLYNIDEEGQISIALPFDRYISSTHGL